MPGNHLLLAACLMIRASHAESASKAKDAEAHAAQTTQAAETTQAQIGTLQDQMDTVRLEAERNRSTVLITGGFAFLSLLIPVLAVLAKTRSEHQAVMDQIALYNARFPK